jgi:hypothetical protein
MRVASVSKQGLLDPTGLSLDPPRTPDRSTSTRLPTTTLLLKTRVNGSRAARQRLAKYGQALDGGADTATVTHADTATVTQWITEAAEQERAATSDLQAATGTVRPRLTVDDVLGGTHRADRSSGNRERSGLLQDGAPILGEDRRRPEPLECEVDAKGQLPHELRDCQEAVQRGPLRVGPEQDGDRRSEDQGSTDQAYPSHPSWYEPRRVHQVPEQEPVPEARTEGRPKEERPVMERDQRPADDDK